MRFDCPKCGSPDTWLESANPHSILRDQATPVLRCRCGLYRHSSQEEILRLVKAAQIKREDALRLVKESKPQEERKRAILPHGKCAWEECQEGARSTSKYCSRQCNNKNARARAKARKLRLVRAA